MTPAEMEDLRQQHYNATLAEVKRANPDLAIFRIRPDFVIPEHKPGQYSTLGLGQWEARVEGCQPEKSLDNPDAEKRLVRRAYSLSCSILDSDGGLIDLSEANFVEIYVVLVREAADAPPALTPRLFMLEKGSRLFLGEKITGRFTAQSVRAGDTVLFLSTGTGEAPHNYMLWELLQRGHEGPILAACCVRYRQDLGYLAVHEELMRRYPNYTYLPLTTREPANAGHKVYIQDLLAGGQIEERLGKALDPVSTQVFLCGNPAMIGVPEVDRATGEASFPQPRGVIEILAERGFKVESPATRGQGNIHFEEYW